MYSCTRPLTFLLKGKNVCRSEKEDCTWFRVTVSFFERWVWIVNDEYLKHNVLGFLFRAKGYFLFTPLFLYDVATGNRSNDEPMKFTCDEKAVNMGKDARDRTKRE